jgi:hypothetical protein
MGEPENILPYAGPRTPPPHAERSRIGCAGAMIFLLGILGAAFFVSIGAAALLIAFSNGTWIGLATLPFTALACWAGASLFRTCFHAMLNPDGHLKNRA